MSAVLVLAVVGVLPAKASAATSGPVTVAGGHGNGSSANQLDVPLGVAVDSRGDVFIADYFNLRVQQWPAGASSGLTVAGGHGSGSAADQVSYPSAVAVDAHGDVFVNDGNKVQEWGPAATQGVTLATGSASAANQLVGLTGLAVDGQGDVFIADQGTDRVQEWMPGAAQGITVAGGHGVGPSATQFDSPVGVAVDGQGDVFIADQGNDRVQEWTPGAAYGITVAGGHGRGSAANQLNAPYGVAVDGHGDVFVADPGNVRVQEVNVDYNPIDHATTSLAYYTTTSDNQAPPVHVGDQVVLVATVNPVLGTRPGQGTVTFSNGAAELGAAPLYAYQASSYAILFTTLSRGSQTITARYSGDSTFIPDNSNPVHIAVTP